MPSKVCARLATRMMQKLGFRIEVADNGLKALELMKENNSRADLVLMDLQMPVVDGYEATRRLRAGGFSRPILALTAHGMAEHQEKSLAAGCDGHLVKPIERDQLINAIAEVL